jgi:hypothetical protein
LKKKNVFLKKSLFAFLLCLALPTAAQTSENAISFDLLGVPQWASDLRRAEIVAFGSFPFTFFYTSFTMDTIRFANHGWNDYRYAPWPFKAAGAVDMTTNEQMLTIGIAVGTSLLIALIDHLIVRSQRNKVQETRNLPPATPIIIRQPIIDEEEGSDAVPFPETESETN